MCSCEPGFTCARCAGTPFDPLSFEDEPAELTEPDFAELLDRRMVPVIMLGEEG